MHSNSILAIDCSSDSCLVALQHQHWRLFCQLEGARAHSQHVLPYIEDVMQQASLSFKQLDAVAVSYGPGSFTGVRLAVAVAKSLAWVDDLRLISLDSLAVLASSYHCQAMDSSSDINNDMHKDIHNDIDNDIDNNNETDSAGACNADSPSQPLTVIRDAKMQEVYLARFSIVGSQLQQLQPSQLLAQAELAQQLAADETKLIAEPASHGLTAMPVTGVTVSADGLLNLAQQQYNAKQFIPMAQLEPLYIRGHSAWKNIAQQQASKP